MENKLKILISLLDDEDQEVASIAMAELLKSKTDLTETLKTLQEDNNSYVRKRVHQLQGIISSRNHRNNISDMLKNKKTDLIKGLTELHILWYDRDTMETIMQYWRALVENCKKNHCTTTDQFAYFLRKYGFKVADKNEVDADFFSIGIILEDLIGADFILCSIAKSLAEKININLEIAYHIGNFILVDNKGTIISPQKDWAVDPIQLDKDIYEVWTTSRILKLAISKLFLCAVSYDSIRYINTIGQTLAKSNDLDALDFLPYPYNVK